MRRPAVNSRLVLLSVSGYVGYHADGIGGYQPLPPGDYTDDFEQNQQKVWLIKLGTRSGDSICELHRRVVATGSPTSNDKETLCLRVAVNDGQFTEIRAVSRPRLRKQGQEAGPNIHANKLRRRIEFGPNRHVLIYHVRGQDKKDRFKIIIHKV